MQGRAARARLEDELKQRAQVLGRGRRDKDVGVAERQRARDRQAQRRGLAAAPARAAHMHLYMNPCLPCNVVQSWMSRPHHEQPHASIVMHEGWQYRLDRCCMSE
jgi:hypothetical protein